MKTFEQCCDEVARKYKFRDWQHLIDYKGDNIRQIPFLKEAAELYSEEKAKDAWKRACQAQINSCLDSLPAALFDTKVYGEIASAQQPEYSPLIQY